MPSKQNKWKVVESKSPTKRELSTWTEKQWITFLQFCLFFINEKEDGTFTVAVTKEKWVQAEIFLSMPDHPFQEFLYRINFFTFDPKATPKKFWYKLTAMMKVTLGYLRINPSIISDEMKKIIEPNPRFNWCLKQTKVVDSPIGEIVVPDTTETVTHVHTNQSIATYEHQLQEAMIKSTNLLTRLVETLGKKDLNKMDTKDLLMAVGRMSWIFSAGRQMKPNSQVFKQINIHSADRDTLEKAMLDFNKNE